MAARDAEMAEVFIVLDRDYENRLVEALTVLTSAGVKVDHADDDNSVVEGTCETKIIPAIKALSMVKYVRTGMTWWADYPEGDPRDVIEPAVRRAETRDAGRIADHMKAISAEATTHAAGASGVVPLALVDTKMTLEEIRKRLTDYPAAGNSLCLVAEVYDDLVGVLYVAGGFLPAYRHSAVISVSVRNDFHGKGVGVALLQAALDWAKASNLLRRLELHAAADNDVAIALGEKLGFQREGIRRQAVLHQGKFVDEVSLALVW